MLTKFQFHCSITCRNILYFVFWLPYCHTLWYHQYPICIIQKLWISLERYEIWQKWKHHSSSLLKAFQIHLFFNTSIFHFIGTLKRRPASNSYLGLALRSKIAASRHYPSDVSLRSLNQSDIWIYKTINFKQKGDENNENLQLGNNVLMNQFPELRANGSEW